MKEVLALAASIIVPVIEAIKSFLTVIFIKKAAEAEIKNEQLKTQNDIQSKQLEIASRPPRPWDAILKLMRDGKR